MPEKHACRFSVQSLILKARVCCCVLLCTLLFLAGTIGSACRKENAPSKIPGYAELNEPDHPEVLGAVLGTNGATLGVLGERDTQGDRAKVSGVVYTAFDGTSSTIMLGADGLPASLITQGWVLRFHGYTTSTVTVDSTGPDGRTTGAVVPIADHRFLDVLLAQSAGLKNASRRTHAAATAIPKPSDWIELGRNVLGAVTCGIGIATAETGVGLVLATLGCGVTYGSMFASTGNDDFVQTALEGTGDVLDWYACGKDIATGDVVGGVLDCSAVAGQIASSFARDIEAVQMAGMAPSLSSVSAVGDLADGTPSTVEISCKASDPEGTIESVTADLSGMGGSSSQELAYDPNTDTWSWSGAVTPASGFSSSVTFTARDNWGFPATGLARVGGASPGGDSCQTGDVTVTLPDSGPWYVSVYAESDGGVVTLEVGGAQVGQTYSPCLRRYNSSLQGQEVPYPGGTVIHANSSNGYFTDVRIELTDAADGWDTWHCFFACGAGLDGGCQW